MNDRLRSAYRDLADEARDYVDPEAVMTAAQRRRRGVPAAMAAAVVLALVAIGITLVVKQPAEPDPSTPAFSPTGPSATLPGLVIGPPPAPSMLPAGGPIGTADLVYSPCARECDPFLRLADGRQFQLPRPRQGTPVNGFALSPDGRWLGQYAEGGGYLVRDLHGATVHRLTGTLDPWAWSPDSRWLLLADHVDGTVHRYVVLDVTSGLSVSHAAVDSGQWRAAGVLPTGEPLLIQVGGERRGLLTVRTVVGATGVETSRRTLDLTDQLATDESLSDGYLYLGAGTIALIGIYAPGTIASAVLLVDMASGRPHTRQSLPQAAGQTGWKPIGLVDVVPLLYHWTADSVQLVTLNRETGAVQTERYLPKDSQVVVRGGGRY